MHIFAAVTDEGKIDALHGENLKKGAFSLPVNLHWRPSLFPENAGDGLRMESAALCLFRGDTLGPGCGPIGDSPRRLRPGITSWAPHLEQLDEQRLIYLAPHRRLPPTPPPLRGSGRSARASFRVCRPGHIPESLRSHDAYYSCAVT